MQGDVTWCRVPCVRCALVWAYPTPTKDITALPQMKLQELGRQ